MLFTVLTLWGPPDAAGRAEVLHILRARFKSSLRKDAELAESVQRDILAEEVQDVNGLENDSFHMQARKRRRFELPEHLGVAIDNKSNNSKDNSNENEDGGLSNRYDDVDDERLCRSVFSKSPRR
jgi:hypothetical protein